MNDAATSLAAALLLDLRTPLSRVSLAASLLDRDTATPASEALVAGIEEAVREIDQRIDRILPLLVPMKTSDGARADLQEIAVKTALRMRPALCARGIECGVEPRREVAIEADGHLARQSAVALLRSALQRLPGGGAASLCVRWDGGRGGLGMQSRAPLGASLSIASSVSQLDEFAFSHGATLDRRSLPDGEDLTLWLPGASPCPAS